MKTFEAAPGINYQNCSEISKYHLKIVWVDPLEHILKGSKYTLLVQAYF